jgi:hypothetical protein
MKEEGKKTGRKCSVCSHEEVIQIDTEINKGVSFRGLSLKYGMSDMSVARHAQNCLALEISTLIKEKKVGRAINVYDEFCEQLAFAKKLRIAAEDYLANGEDPGKIDLIPRAHEIEVTYYDNTELNEFGKPRKKTNTLAFLLDEVESQSDMESTRVTVKHIDIRKFALDAISVADLCIDRFAKLGGDYTKEKQNASDIADIAEEIVNRLTATGWTEDEARTMVTQKYPDISNAVN